MNAPITPAVCAVWAIILSPLIFFIVARLVAAVRDVPTVADDDGESM